MNIRASTWNRYLRAALLVVLLAAQGLAAAHEFTHSNHPAQELCATCSLSSGLDTPVAFCIPDLEFVQTSEFFFEYTASHVHGSAPNPYHQRAPPVSL